MSKYQLRKQSKTQILFANAEDKEQTMKSLTKKEFVQLVTPYFGKPICIVANIFRVTYETFIECCKINGITEWPVTVANKFIKGKRNSSMKRARADNKHGKNPNKIKKISEEGFIIGTYDNDQDYNYSSDEEIRKKKNKRTIIKNNFNKRIIKKNIDFEIDFSSDEENIVIDFLDESTVTNFLETNNCNSTGKSDTDIDDNLHVSSSSDKLITPNFQDMFNKMDKLIDEMKTFLYKPNETACVKFVSKTARKSVFKPNETTHVKFVSKTARKSVFKPKKND